MDTNLIIAGAIGIVIIFFIIKFAKKLIGAALIVIAILALGVAGYIYYFDLSSMNDLHAKYCEDLSNKNDSLKCVCIIEPLEEDFNTRKIDSDNISKEVFIKELLISFKNKRNVINEKLKENNALHLLDGSDWDFLKRQIVNKLMIKL